MSLLNQMEIYNVLLYRGDQLPTIKSNLRNLSKRGLPIATNMMESRISLFEEMQIFPLAQIERLRSELVFYKNAYNIGGKYV